ncbi:MAG: hypothetical protein EOP45_01065 [Sphingobacteriaceae bacterium]|nr:MAG: hypothetical protein EOP45_01065 [Sphingobacteriaceae bacterium]
MQNLNNNSGENLENKEVLLLTVDGIDYNWSEEFISGEQIRKLANAPSDSLESKLFLAIQRPWQDELIENDKLVNLARPEIEHFYFKNILLLTINGKEYSWDKEYITGAELKKIAGIPEADELFLSIKKPWVDELIENDKQVNLARPGIENFYSKKLVVYSFFIDKKSYTTTQNHLMVRQILLEFAKVAVDKNTLAEKVSGGFTEFKNVEESLDLTQVRYFSIFNNMPTSVS